MMHLHVNKIACCLVKIHLLEVIVALGGDVKSPNAALKTCHCVHWVKILF